jgi:hypothetical protein
MIHGAITAPTTATPVSRTRVIVRKRFAVSN